MKLSISKLTLLSIAFFLVGLLGCRIQEATPSLPAPQGVNLDLVLEVESIAEQQVQRLAFTKMLSNEEKIFFFKKRIAEKIQVLSLSGEQKAHLELLVATLSPDLYTDSAKGRKGINFISKWTQKGKILFREEVLYDIVASLESAKAGKKNATNRGSASGTVCNCATSSDYCDEDYACTYIPSCNIRGCGTMLMFTCNGSCDRLLPQY